MQGAWPHCTELYQTCQTFKLTGSVSHQVSLLERTVVPSPVIHQNMSGQSLNGTSTGSQHVSTTSVVGDMHQIASVSSTGRLIKLVGLVDQHPVVVMVDSGSTGDFISDTYVSQHELHEYEYKHSKTVWLADGKQHTVSKYIECQLDIGDMSQSIQLAVLPLIGHDIILGTTCLQRHNPHINWISGTVTVEYHGKPCVLPQIIEHGSRSIEVVSALQI